MPTTSAMGGHHFADLHTHPGPKKPGEPSSASGAYQIIHKTYEAAVQAGIAHGFSERDQDEIALWKMRDALAYIHSGQLDAAFASLDGTWDALPGGGHQLVNSEAAKADFWMKVREYSQ